MRPLLGLTLILIVTAATAGCLETPRTSSTNSGGPNAAATSSTPRLCVSTLDATVSAGNVTWVLDTTMGTVRITLLCSKAPISSQNFVNLTEKGYFDRIKFHRVIEGFMDQGGDPLTMDDSKKAAWGTGGPGYTIKDEFYCADGTIDNRAEQPKYSENPTYSPCRGFLGLRHDKAGVLSMANSGPNTGGSQFFITAVATPHLDGNHAVFGHTADQASLDVALAINRVPTDSSDRPVTPVVINKAVIEWT